MRKVVIIMPVYNSGKHLRAALNSIVQNTEYPNWRLIIVCSKSNDGTDQLCDEFVEKYPEKIMCYHTEREGITKAINFGISHTEDEDIYLTQDDVIIPKLYGRDWLTILTEYAKLDNCGLVSTIAAGGIDTMNCYIKDFHWIGTWSMYIPRQTINEVCFYEEK